MAGSHWEGQAEKHLKHGTAGNEGWMRESDKSRQKATLGTSQPPGGSHGVGFGDAKCLWWSPCGPASLALSDNPLGTVPRVQVN